MELLTPDDVCDLLKVSKDWLYDQVEADRIPYLKVGRRLRFRPAEVGAWLRGEWEPPVAEEPEPVTVVSRRGRPRKN